MSNFQLNFLTGAKRRYMQKQRSRFIHAALSALPLLVVTPGVCADPAVEDSTPPNMVTHIVDTLRRDSLGCCGHAIGGPPGVDAFAKDAALFTNAFVQSCWTRASILTSTYPCVHDAEDE